MYFPVTSGIIFQRKVAAVKAVDGVSFDIQRGETLGLVGESGCGKTTLGRVILQLYKPTAGRSLFEGQDLTRMNAGRDAPHAPPHADDLPGPVRLAQPAHDGGHIVAEPLVIHSLAKSRNERQERVQELMRIVGLNPYFANRYPHEFSGGQRQRIGIARALAVTRRSSSPTSRSRRWTCRSRRRSSTCWRSCRTVGLTYLFIAHDLTVVRHISDRVAVMYLGKIVELTDRRSCTRTRCTPTRRRCSRPCRSPTRRWRCSESGSS